jgi:hypothetical protein
MTQPSIAVDFNQALDIHLHLTTQITFSLETTDDTA